jgi:YkoY family integral membrane protein
MLLSADNAVVLGLLSNTLPAPLRRKALFIGAFSAFFLRAAALLLVSYLLEYIWLQLLGAAYLFYLSIRYFIQKGKSAHPAPSHSFWKTVILIELFDLIFAFDSILAGVAFIDFQPTKLWIVYIGGMVGLFSMRFAARLFGTLLDRFPRLEMSAYLMIGLIGVKLSTGALHHPLPDPLFWALLTSFFLSGFFGKKKQL